jgi:hypothetical protein
MNTERIKELAREAAGGMLSYDAEGEWRLSEREVGKLTELIVRECVNTLEFHGFENAVPYIKWMATNKLGVEE